MYEIMFEINNENNSKTILEYNLKIKKFLIRNNFNWIQGNIFNGNNTVDVVNCILIIQELFNKYPEINFKYFDMYEIKKIESLLPLKNIKSNILSIS
jgi:virulence-associated protein VapD